MGGRVGYSCRSPATFNNSANPPHKRTARTHACPQGQQGCMHMCVGGGLSITRQGWSARGASRAERARPTRHTQSGRLNQNSQETKKRGEVGECHTWAQAPQPGPPRATNACRPQRTATTHSNHVQHGECPLPEERQPRDTPNHTAHMQYRQGTSHRKVVGG